MYQCHPVGGSKRDSRKFSVGLGYFTAIGGGRLVGLREVTEADCRNSLLDWRPIRFDERFLIECFFHLCYVSVGRSKSRQKLPLSFFFLFWFPLVSFWLSVVYFPRGEKEKRDKRRNDIILPTWGPYTVELSGREDERFSSFGLFSLVFESSLSCRFGRWLDPSGLEWWSTGHGRRVCSAPGEVGGTARGTEGGLITLHAHSLFSSVILFFPLFSSLLPSPSDSPPLCLFPIGWRGGWQRPARQPMPSRHDGCEIPTERSGASRSRGLCFAFLASAAVKGGSSKGRHTQGRLARSFSLVSQRSLETASIIIDPPTKVVWPR